MSKHNCRYCKLYYCHVMKDRVCYADCPKYLKCKNEDKDYIPKKERTNGQNS